MQISQMMTTNLSLLHSSGIRTWHLAILIWKLHRTSSVDFIIRQLLLSILRSVTGIVILMELSEALL
jgi:hypothetical protein